MLLLLLFSFMPDDMRFKPFDAMTVAFIYNPQENNERMNKPKNKKQNEENENEKKSMLDSVILKLPQPKMLQPNIIKAHNKQQTFWLDAIICTHIPSNDKSTTLSTCGMLKSYAYIFYIAYTYVYVDIT